MEKTVKPSIPISSSDNIWSPLIQAGGNYFLAL